MSNQICEMEGCEQEAKFLTSSETKIIEICKDHWNEKYKS
jgi:hypothetical protein